MGAGEAHQGHVPLGGELRLPGPVLLFKIPVLPSKRKIKEARPLETEGVEKSSFL